MQNKTQRIFLHVFGSVLICALLWPIHLVSDGSYATCYSRENEAYLFPSGSHIGYHFPAIAYPFGFALAHVSGYAAAGLLRPNDTQPILIVLHITPTSLERHSLNEKDQDVSFITPFADGLYGMCPGSILCKWTDKRFEPATPDQIKSVGGVENLVRGSTGGQPVNEWLITRTYAAGQKSEIPIGKEITIILQNHGQTRGINNWITVDIVRAGRTSDRVYDVDARKPRLVSKATYDRIFAAQHAAN